MDILKVENLTFKYPGKEKPAVNNVSFNIKEGDFVVLFGESGCGKTTLLRLLKKELMPAGALSGQAFYKGVQVSELDSRRSAGEIGFVLQNPERQIVTEKVFHELAFGLENMGLDSAVIRQRVAEMASYFGISELIDQDIKTLSGGQKQLVNLASIMAMRPNLLLLDEPTAQLDPIAAGNFINTLKKLNEELGLTIILCEHRLEELFPIADSVMMMKNGSLLINDTPRNVGEFVMSDDRAKGDITSLPSAMRIYYGTNAGGECPLTVKECQRLIDTLDINKGFVWDKADDKIESETAIEVRDVWFRYEKKLPDVLCGTRMDVKKGELFAIVGGNGSGKTTLLTVVSGQSNAYSGKIKIFGKDIKKYSDDELYQNILAFLPQDPQTVFLENTVSEDFLRFCKRLRLSDEEARKRIDYAAKKLGIEDCMGSHPYDLSGGEQQKAAIAKLLLKNPRILLLDEPTKGIDMRAKENFGEILKALKNDGITVVMVTHDIEFTSYIADKVALFFNGEIVSVNDTRAFFSDNHYYTTAASRIARHVIKSAITCDDVIMAANNSEVAYE